MKKKVSTLTLIICCLLVFVVTYFISSYTNNKKVPLQTVMTVDCSNTMDQLRLKKYQFIQPLILTDVNTESPSLSQMHMKIEEYIGHMKNGRKAEDISVYFRRMNDGSWFCINPNRAYSPDGLTSIIYLISYLKEAEINPSVISKKILFTQHLAEENKNKTESDFSLKENESYTVNDLLNYMIKYSDEDAMSLLKENMNQNTYNQVFSDLNIPVATKSGDNYISALDYSKFYRILYNASYIRPEYSEFGLRLLTSNTFSDGLRKGIDSTTIIAHKSGTYNSVNKSELHEFGIVFINGDPYLIGVMTTGTDLRQLSDIVGEISRIAYTEYVNLFHS